MNIPINNMLRSRDGFNDSPIALPTAPHVAQAPAAIAAAPVQFADLVWSTFTNREGTKSYQSQGRDGAYYYTGNDGIVYHLTHPGEIFNLRDGFKAGTISQSLLSQNTQGAPAAPAAAGGIAGTIAAAIQLPAKIFAPAIAPPAAVAPPLPASTDPAATTTAGNSTVAAAGGAIAALPSALQAALASALAGGGGGYTSPDMAVGVPSTAGIVSGQTAALDALQPAAAPTASRSTSSLPLIIVGAIAVGGFLLFERFHKKKKA